MTRGRPALALVLLGGAALSAAADTQAGGELRTVELPGATQLPSPPPLDTAQSVPFAQLLPRRSTVRARTTVTAVARPGGTVSRLTAVQRLVIAGTGDFAFAIPAPALDVAAAPGSQSEPGLRPGQVLWQGFSARRKVLAALMTLRAREAAPAIPVRIRVRGAPVRPGRFAMRIVVTNTTATRVAIFGGTPVPTDLRRAESALQQAARAGLPLRPTFVRIRGPLRAAAATVSASIDVDLLVRLPPGAARVTGLRVNGVAVTPSQSIRFSRTTGAGAPAAVRVEIIGVARHRVRPSIAVRARPKPNRPVGGRGRGRPAGNLRRLVETRLRYERTRQYDSLLASPDPRGPSDTQYVLRVREAARAPAATGHAESGRGVPVAIIGGLAVLAAAAFVVVWAHL